MKNLTSLLGWLLLAAILAVPSFLFYNWWSTNKKNEALAQVPVQSISTAAIFPGAPDASTTLPQSVPQPQKTARVEESPADNAPAPSTAAQISTAAVKSPSAAQSTAAVGGSMAPAAQAQASTHSPLASFFNPKSDRDPTMSPAEYRKLHEEEERRREEERNRQLALHRRTIESGGETRITLQGIVGNSVIINGEAYWVGNTVKGVKLLKIGSDYVIGEYKGRKFKKVL